MNDRLSYGVTDFRGLFQSAEGRSLLIRHWEFELSTGELVVATDLSRHPVRVRARPDQRYDEFFGTILAELQQRRANRLFHDGRHDHFKGFRDNHSTRL